MICFLCEDLLEAPCLLMLEKKERHTELCVHDCGAYNGNDCVEALKCYHEMPSSYTDILTPYYSNLTWCVKLDTTCYTQ